MTKNKNKGFTIVELVIVIAVVAVLAAVLIPTFSGIVEKANESAALQRAVSAYKEAYALALSDDGVISTADNTNNQVDGFTFTWANDGTCTVGTPDNFNYDVTVSGGKVSVDADGSTPNPNPGGNTPPAQGGENEGEGGNNEPQQPAQPAAPKVLYAIGDSITNGKNGDSQENTERWTINSGWLKYVVTEENGFDIVNSKNLGISGIGFKTNSNNCPNVSIRDVIDATDALEDAEYTKDKFGDYSLADADIITVALGINDWKNSAVTVEAYFAEMEYCLTRIRDINPNCEIYYIMPFNIILGDKETDYALGFKSGDSSLCYGNTLGEFKQMIRDKFTAGEFGDVKLIDIEPFTADEMETYLPDTIHPNAAGYAKIGAELAAALTASGN